MIKVRTMASKYFEDVAAGVEYVRGHVLSDVESGSVARKVQFLASGGGDPYACAIGLARHYLGKAMLAWFEERQLEHFKQYMYAVAKLERIAFQAEPGRRVADPVYLGALLCDNSALLNWFTTYVVTTDADRSGPKSHEFRWAQMMHSLRGNWPVVEQRANQVLDLAPPLQKKFMADHRFYLSLARGDIAGMETALAELTSEKMARVRNDELPFGLTHFFVGTHAVMYAKLAWIHGFQVHVDTPYIPPEWLPAVPLAEYKDPHDFMRAFDIGQPLA